MGRKKTKKKKIAFSCTEKDLWKKWRIFLQDKENETKEYSEQNLRELINVFDSRCHKVCFAIHHNNVKTLPTVLG